MLLFEIFARTKASIGHILVCELYIQPFGSIYLSIIAIVDAFFMPRNDTDRPKVVLDGAVNFAFIGQFAETARDTIFTTEYSMRTGMEAVYTLLNVDRGVPEVWGQHI